MRQNGPKMPIFGQKRQFCAKTPFFGVDGVKYLVPSYQGTNESPFCVKTIDRCGSNSPLGTKMCNFDPKFWGQKLIFFLELRFLTTGHITHKPRAATLPFGPPRKVHQFPSYGSFFGPHPCFWPFRAFPTSLLQVPLILDCCQQNLVGQSGPSKK